MSRSYLHNKEILKRFYFAKPLERNPHKRDEMPKNHVSKYISTHGGSYAAWLEDATSFGGHKRQKGGHRRVSGIVRANVKEEIRQQIAEQIEE